MFCGDWDCYPSSDDDFEENLLQIFSDTDYSSSSDELETTLVEVSNESDYVPSSDIPPESTFVERSKRQKEDEDLGHSEETSAQRSKKQKKYYLDHVVPKYSDSEFLKHFCLPRQVVEDIAEKFRNSVYYHFQAGGNGKLIPLHQILVFLWFTGHETDTFRNVAERFSISASTLCLVVRRVTNFICSVCSGVIKWPSDEEKVAIESHFGVNGLPGVVGAVGVTHIKIDKPQRDPPLYVNERRFFSIHLQVVSDHKRRIRDIFVGCPGSVDVETVFRKSPLFKHLGEMCGDFCIVGDSAYPCHKHLLTPYTSSEYLTRQQQDFNIVLSRNTRVVEHCFQLLKKRFRQLIHIKLRNIDDIVHFIQACCILHNIAIDDSFVFETNEGERDKDTPAEEVAKDTPGEEVAKDTPGEEVADDLEIQGDQLEPEEGERTPEPFLIPCAEEVVYFDEEEDESGLEKRDRIAAQMVISSEEEIVYLDNEDDTLELENRDMVTT